MAATRKRSFCALSLGALLLASCSTTQPGTPQAQQQSQPPPKTDQTAELEQARQEAAAAKQQAAESERARQEAEQAKLAAEAEAERLRRQPRLLWRGTLSVPASSFSNAPPITDAKSYERIYGSFKAAPDQIITVIAFGETDFFKF